MSDECIICRVRDSSPGANHREGEAAAVSTLSACAVFGLQTVTAAICPTHRVTVALVVATIAEAIADPDEPEPVTLRDGTWGELPS